MFTVDTVSVRHQSTVTKDADGCACQSTGCVQPHCAVCSHRRRHWHERQCHSLTAHTLPAVSERVSHSHANCLYTRCYWSWLHNHLMTIFCLTSSEFPQLDCFSLSICQLLAKSLITLLVFVILFIYSSVGFRPQH